MTDPGSKAKLLFKLFDQMHKEKHSIVFSVQLTSLLCVLLPHPVVFCFERFFGLLSFM